MPSNLRLRWRSAGLVLGGAMLMVGATFGHVAAIGQQPTFRSAVDVVLVEVQVVEAQGRPATTIRADQFSVTIDGRRRQVLSADLMMYADAGASVSAVPGASVSARNLWPATGDEAGRLFVLAIDEASFPAAEGARVARSARAFVDRLGVKDAVSLVTFPRGESVRPTTDRVAIGRAIAKVSGTLNLRPNPFHLSAAEVIDINAEIDQMASSSLTTVTARGRVQAITVEDVLRQVQTRECRSGDPVCAQALLIEAESQARVLEEQVTDSLSGFKRLLALLREYPGRKTVVVLSAGMPVSDRSGRWHHDGSEARALGRAAAEANATIYAIHVDGGYRAVFNAENRTSRPAMSLARERDLQQRLLADLASASGGTLFEAPTDTGDAALGRVLSETSTFYALGIAPEARDLDGRAHELRVSVDDPKASVRARRFVVLRRPQQQAATS